MFDHRGLRYAALYQFLIVNAFALALLVVAGVNGWIGLVLLADVTHIMKATSALFVFGFVLSLWRMYKLSRAVNLFWDQGESAVLTLGMEKATAHSAQYLIGSYIGPVKNISTFLFLMGLGGTIVGLIIALSGVDPTAAGDMAKTAAMLGTLLYGVSIKLYSSLVGLILSFWTLVNYSLLSTTAQRVLAYVLEARKIGM